MANHPNRGKTRGPASTPRPEEIVRVREKAGHTQRQAADTIHGSEGAWRNWEQGLRPMHPGLFELYKLKTGQSELGSIVLSTAPPRATYKA